MIGSDISKNPTHVEYGLWSTLFTACMLEGNDPDKYKHHFEKLEQWLACCRQKTPNLLTMQAIHSTDFAQYLALFLDFMQGNMPTIFANLTAHLKTINGNSLIVPCSSLWLCQDVDSVLSGNAIWHSLMNMPYKPMPTKPSAPTTVVNPTSTKVAPSHPWYSKMDLSQDEVNFLKSKWHCTHCQLNDHTLPNCDKKGHWMFQCNDFHTWEHQSICGGCGNGGCGGGHHGGHGGNHDTSTPTTLHTHSSPPSESTVVTQAACTQTITNDQVNTSNHATDSPAPPSAEGKSINTTSPHVLGSCALALSTKSPPLTAVPLSPFQDHEVTACVDSDHGLQFKAPLELCCPYQLRISC